MLHYACKLELVWEAMRVLPMRPELLKGHLDALLLAVLEPGPRAVTVHSSCPPEPCIPRCTGWNAPG